MTIATIICEFNPFSKGHKYLIDNVRRDLNPDAVVCIMSGNFVQRGQMACMSKWDRAKIAVENGADLVIQMPCCVSLSSAEYFAKGSVDIAKGINSDFLCFGSELGDLSELKKLSADGIHTLEEGNNILACEYLRCLGRSIKPWTIKINKKLGHASDYRSKHKNIYENNLYLLEKYCVVSKTAFELSRAPEVSEGLENRLKTAVIKAENHDDFVKAIKSKRYNYTRISRILLQIVLGISSSKVSRPYGLVLAFNQNGQKVIKNSKIKLYSNLKPSDLKENKHLQEDVRADDIYSVLTEKTIYEYSDFVCKPSKSNI